jgi:hypothetical protein
MDMQDAVKNSIDTATTLAGVGSKVTYAGAGWSSVAWLLTSEAGILVGICMATCGFLMNWYYSRKKDRREQREHDARMDEMRAGAKKFDKQVKHDDGPRAP